MITKKTVFFTLLGSMLACALIYLISGNSKLAKTKRSDSPSITNLKTSLEIELSKEAKVASQITYFPNLISELANIKTNPLCQFGAFELNTLMISEHLIKEESEEFLSECLHLILTKDRNASLEIAMRLLRLELENLDQSKIKTSKKIRIFAVLIAYIKKNIHLAKSTSEKDTALASIKQAEARIAQNIQEYLNLHVNYLDRTNLTANCDFHWGISPLITTHPEFATYGSGIASVLEKVYKVMNRQYPLNPILIADLSYCLQADVDKNDTFSKTYNYQLASSILDKLIRWNVATKDLKICGKKVGLLQIYDPYVNNQTDDTDLCKISPPTFESNFRMYHLLNRLED